MNPNWYFSEAVTFKWRELKWFFKSTKQRMEWFKEWAKFINLPYIYLHWDYVSLMYEGQFYIVNLKSFYVFGLHTGMAPVYHLKFWHELEENG